MSVLHSCNILHDVVYHKFFGGMFMIQLNYVFNTSKCYSVYLVAVKNRSESYNLIIS